MGGNRIKWLIGAVFAVLVVIAVLNGEDDASAPSPSRVGNGSGTPSAPRRPEAPVLTADSDTMAETLRTVQAQYGEQRRTNEALQDDLRAMREELARLEEESQNDPDSEQQSALARQVEQMQSMLDSLTTSSQGNGTLPDLGFGNALPGDDYQVGESGADYWTESGDHEADQETTRARQATVRGYVRLKPLTSSKRRPDDSGASGNNPSDDAAFNQWGSPDSGSTGSGLGGELFGENTPLATIPARSTLFDATAMTALIGRVPVSGQVVDPFPVKVIVGDDNLAANGHHIPGLRGIIFDGTARGDWTMGCVSVSLMGATYIFEDGTISHLNGTTGVDDSIEQGAASLYGNESGDSIGYLSDVQGTPCLSGTKITDAYKQAGLATVLGGLQGWAQYRADAERTTTTGAGSGVVVDSVTGDKSAFSQYGLAATGLEETLQIIKDRFQDTFDAIYIPPGKQVALHIGRDLHIVHKSNAPKIVYDQDLGGSHALD